MSWFAEFPAPQAWGARVIARVLRGAVWVLSRGGLRPAVSVKVQRRLLWLGTRLNRVAPRVRYEAGMLGDVPCEWLLPACDGGGVMLYLHGGAFIAGSPQTHRSLTSHLAQAAGARVCALDYRLAPEYPFPVGRDDALSAYQALLAEGHTAQRIVLAGDSAGGNLVLSCALRLRELGLPQPAALLCFSPFTDLAGGNLQQPEGGDPLIQPQWLEQGAQAYCSAGGGRDDPQVSPHYAELHGLPALLVQVGEDECLLPQSRRLIEHAQAAAVDCRLELYRQQWHVFQLNCGLLASADLAVHNAVEFLRQRGYP